ncbi:senescence-associated carboxylesterase 101-like [Telopea speciosissima]|uniref:senescence-associated carboxylesterase 101-like n=1 Tax=Telopea speciosissima TaxID=54955 RepID=UPI001CC80AF3|nr:senescence-associated carboxylesterase 101-like [Telopea speciosissima]
MSQPNQENAFSCGSELGDVVLGSGLLHCSLPVIQQLNDDSTKIIKTTSSSSLSVAYKICDGYENKYQIIAFGIGVGGEVSSELSPTLEQNPSEFNFLQIKNDPFSINEEALSLFRSLRQDEDLFQLLKNPTKPLIITGHSIGGWIASLFCLWLLDKIKPSNPNFPICITFGSPLLGDDGLCRAIHNLSGWKSRFLHVVSYGDLIPRTFLSSTENIYKPFGTFLICSSSSSACACFNDPVSVVDVLAATSASPQMPNILDYGKLLEDLNDQMIVSKGVSELWGSRGDPLRAGIILQLDAIGVQRNQENMEDTLITDMERWERKNYRGNMQRISEADKKLNDMKINMANLEWYKKISSTDLPMGYYDCYKNKPFPRDIYVVKFKKALRKYWEDVVNEAETKPQKQGVPPLPIRLLYAGTNYRRMVEPLDIAEYYKELKEDKISYRMKGRSKHYELLETWLEENEKAGEHQRRSGKRDIAATLTEDSCFWAEVEEAMIWTKSLKNGEAVGKAEESLIEQLNNFEEYVIGLINNLAVSLEIFLKESTFMQWWKEYEKIPKRNRSSGLANYMENGRYQKYK